MVNVFEDTSKRIYQNLGNQVDNLSNQTILLTGASGFLGSGMCNFVDYVNKNKLVSHPIRLIAYDNFLYKKPTWLNELSDNKYISFFEKDILNIDDYPQSDFVIHAASVASPTFYRKYPLETIDANVVGLRNILNSSLKLKPRSILFFSTSEVYGDPSIDNIPTKETYFGNVNSFGPRASYDESKRLSETLCYIYFKKYNLPVKVVRPFNNYGPGLSLNDGRVIPDFFKNILNKEDINILSDGKATRTFCYLSDALTGYFLTLFSDFDGEIFNIGSESPEVSMEELADLIIKISNSDSKIAYKKSTDEDYLTNNPSRRCPDISKASNLLGFTPKVNLEEGLKLTYEYYLQEF